jgi:DNA-binding response OmpR family regulator
MLSALKSDRICNSILVVVLIEGPTPIEAHVVLDIGALLYLEKPFNFDEHVSLARKLIDSVADPLSKADFRTDSGGKRP